jgi:hypothetical protein
MGVREQGLAALLLLVGGVTSANAWQVIRHANGSDVEAMLSMTVGDGRSITLIVDFVKSFQCNPVISLMEMRGTTLGPALSNSARRGSQEFEIQAGSVSARFYPWIVDYQNGSESVCNESQCGPVLTAMSAGQVPIRVFAGTKGAFEFPASSDAALIRRAKARCISGE